MTRNGAGGAILISVGLFVLALGTWQWRASVFETDRAAVDRESWDGIKVEYPLPAEAVPEIAGLAAGAADAAAQANPFSPLRRSTPVTSGGGESGTGSGTGSAGHPQFIYKGRILLGSRQRAIVEETTSRKTHFLEVGQEVAGLKVLDIAETQVLLSDTRTGSEVVLALKKPATSP